MKKCNSLNAPSYNYPGTLGVSGESDALSSPAGASHDCLRQRVGDNGRLNQAVGTCYRNLQLPEVTQVKV